MVVEAHDCWNVGRFVQRRLREEAERDALSAGVGAALLPRGFEAIGTSRPNFCVGGAVLSLRHN
jgi:hypothetical protein